MAKRKRRAFTKEFKAQAVRVVRQSGKRGPKSVPHFDGSWLGWWWRRLRKATPLLLVSAFSLDELLRTERSEGTQFKRSNGSDFREPRVGHYWDATLAVTGRGEQREPRPGALRDWAAWLQTVYCV